MLRIATSVTVMLASTRESAHRSSVE